MRPLENAVGIAIANTQKKISKMVRREVTSAKPPD